MSFMNVSNSTMDEALGISGSPPAGPPMGGPPPFMAELQSLLAMLSAAQKFQKIITSIALAVGVPANIICLIVFFRPAMRCSSAAPYFIFLAVSDTVTLLAGIPHDLMGYSRKGFGNSYSQLTCRLSLFFLRAFSTGGLYYIAFLCFDRFVAVCYPFKAHTILSRKRSIIICTVVTVVSIAAQVSIFVTRGNQKIGEVNGTDIMINCGFTSRKAEYYENKIGSWLSLIFVMGVPIVSVSVFNILIIARLRRSSEFRGKSTSEASEKTRREWSMTAMLIAAAVVTFVSLTPQFTTSVALLAFADQSDPIVMTKFAIAIIVTVSLNFLNCGINFLLYFVGGITFRKEFAAVMKCK